VPLLPLFPLDLVLFPGAPLPLHIFEPRYKEMIGECLQAQSPFGLVRAHENAVAEVGCTAEILKVVKRYDDGRLDILTEGRRRFEVLELNQERSFLRAEVLFFEDDAGAEAAAPSAAAAIEATKAQELHSKMMDILGAGDDVPGDESDVLSFRLAAALPTDLDFKQSLLAMRSEPDRLNLLIDYYGQIIPKLERNAAARKKAAGNGHVR
jgi:Lon protease-like protein